MLQRILSIAGSELHLTKQSHQFRMDAMYADFEGGRFALLFHHNFDFLLRLLDHFLNSGRMNTPVHDQLFECDPRYFPADRVKAGENNCLGRIVND